VAEHIAASGLARPAPAGDLAAAAGRAVAQVEAVLRPGSPLSIRSVRSSVQARMSDRAGMICDAAGVREALAEAHALNAEVRAHGIACGRPAEAVRALQWRQMALASEAVLAALDHYIGTGGGSRGARAICDPDGTEVPQTREGPLEAYRFRPERDAHRAEQIVVRLEGEDFHVTTRRNRPFDEGARPFFERDWPDWLTGRIFDVGRDDGRC
jgi:succinate dehydrogenase / fumarate reductase flavoprotein subunit